MIIRISRIIVIQNIVTTAIIIMLIRWRIIIAILGSIGMAIIYGLKVNLSMAIVSMVDQTVVEETNKTDISQSKASI